MSLESTRPRTKSLHEISNELDLQFVVPSATSAGPSSPSIAIPSATQKGALQGDVPFLLSCSPTEKGMFHANPSRRQLSSNSTPTMSSVNPSTSTSVTHTSASRTSSGGILRRTRYASCSSERTIIPEHSLAASPQHAPPTAPDSRTDKVRARAKSMPPGQARFGDDHLREPLVTGTFNLEF